MPSLITPANLSHLHLLLNHFPTVGLTVAFILLVVSIFSDAESAKHDTMKPTALGVLFGIAVVTLLSFPGLPEAWRLSLVRAMVALAAGTVVAVWAAPWAFAEIPVPAEERR